MQGATEWSEEQWGSHTAPAQPIGTAPVDLANLLLSAFSPQGHIIAPSSQGPQEWSASLLSSVHLPSGEPLWVASARIPPQAH